MPGEAEYFLQLPGRYPHHAFVRSGLGVTISQELVMQAFGCPGVVSRPLEPACCRTLGLAFSKTASSVVSQTLLEYLSSTRQRKETPEIK